MMASSREENIRAGSEGKIRLNLGSLTGIWAG